MGAAAAGTRGGSRLRSHARAPLPSHGAVSAMAFRQETGDCTYAQLEVVAPHELEEIFAAGLSLICSLDFLRDSAIHASDRHPDPAFPAMAANLPARGADSPGCASKWRTPRMESTSTSSTARVLRNVRVFLFHLSRPGKCSLFARRICNHESGILFAASCAALAARADTRRLALHLPEVRRPWSVAESRRFVAVCEFEKLSANPGDASMSACGSPISREALGDCETVKSAGIAVRHFVPVERRRYTRIRQRTHRVGRAGRAILRVLVVVEKHAVPLFLPPLRTGQRWRAPLDFARQRQRRATHLGEASSVAGSAR